MMSMPLPKSSISPPPNRGTSKQGIAVPLLKTAGLIAAITLLSKVTGAVRDWQIMHFYGAGDATDAYFAAFQLPSFALILLGGLGGPFHTATVSLYQRWKNELGEPEARSRIGSFLTLTHWLFLALSIAVFVAAKPIVSCMLGNPRLVPIATYHLQVMSPILWLGGVVGILYAWGHLHQRFFWPSFAPALVNLALIISLYVFPTDAQGNILAWTTTLGAALQVLAQLPDAFKDNLPFRANLPEEHKAQWWHPQGPFGMLWGLLLPAMVGTTIGQLITYVDIAFATSLPSGSWAALTLANRLMQLPIGVLQTALLVPLFPQLAEAASQGSASFTTITRLARQGIVGLWMLCLPVLLVVWFDAEHLIRLVFQRGAFDAQDTLVVTTAVVFQAFQMIPYFARDTFVRVCYAFQNAKTPLLIGCIAIGLKWLLNGWLSQASFLGIKGLALGVGGIAFATSAITWLNMTLLSMTLQRQHMPSWSFWNTLGKPFIQLLPAIGVMGGWLYLIHHRPITTLFGVSLHTHEPLSMNAWILLVGAWGIGIMLYATVIHYSKLEEWQWVMTKLRTRFPQIRGLTGKKGDSS
ncbi:MAG: murein biosynthesis integral membrane protein MurJ [Vampirovibrionales bacterium]